MIRLLLIAFALAAAPVATTAAQEEPSTQRSQSEAERIARAYMDAYSAADWNAMAPFMAEDILFTDHTNPDPDFEHELRGRDALLTTLHAFSAQYGVAELGFEWAHVFESNGIVVFSGFVNSLGAPPEQEAAYRWRAEQVTVIRIVDGRVARHDDFANYNGAQISRVPRPN